MDDVQRQLNQNNDEHRTFMNKIEKLGEDVGKELGDIKLSLAKLPQELIELFDERYASKKTEKAIYWMAGIIFVALISLGTFVIETFIKQ